MRQAAGDELVPQPGDHLVPLGVRGPQPQGLRGPGSGALEAGVSAAEPPMTCSIGTIGPGSKEIAYENQCCAG